jgi:DNA-binding MarR family transcriptional regulator
MAKLSRGDIIEGILKLSDRLFRTLLPVVPRMLLQIDVSMSQMKIMLSLFIIGPMRMSDLAADLQVTLATATGLVDHLVEKDIVVRESQADDRRVVLCQLSDSGRQMVSGIWESARNNTRGLLQCLDTGKLEMLTEVLETMLQSADRVKEQLTKQ